MATQRYMNKADNHWDKNEHLKLKKIEPKIV